jgi:hypothetical protein
VISTNTISRSISLGELDTMLPGLFFTQDLNFILILLLVSLCLESSTPIYCSTTLSFMKFHGCCFSYIKFTLNSMLFNVSFNSIISCGCRYHSKTRDFIHLPHGCQMVWSYFGSGHKTGVHDRNLEQVAHSPNVKWTLAAISTAMLVLHADPYFHDILVWTPCLMHRCVISTMFGSCFSSFKNFYLFYFLFLCVFYYYYYYL